MRNLAIVPAPELIAREYLRVSQDASGRLLSPKQQHAENADAVEEHGWAFGEPYGEDEAISASRYGRKARPGFAALVRDLESGRFGADILIVYTLSRGSRKAREWARLIEALFNANVSVFETSSAMLYDVTNHRHRKWLRDGASEAEAESDQKSVEVGKAMRAEAREGRPHGGPILYGYTRIYRIDDMPDRDEADDPRAGLAPDEYLLDPKQKTRRIARQVEHPDQGPVVRDLFASILAGESLASIGRRHGMEPTRVRDIALNIAYAGKRRHIPEYRGGHQPEVTEADLTDAPWPALVSYSDWRKVERKLRDPARRTSPPGRAPAHLLSMIAVCGKCGAPLSVRFKGGREHGTPRYTCRGGTGKAKGSGHVTLDRDPLDRYVIGAIMAVMTDPEEWALMAEPANDAELQAARDELARIRAEHHELGRLVGDGVLSAAAMAVAEPGILARLDAASKRVRELEAPAGVADLGLAPGTGFKRRWNAATLESRRALIKLLFASITVEAIGRGAQVPAEERTVIIERRKMVRS